MFYRRELQVRLEQLILLDPDLANKQNAEQMLWKSVFYHMVEMIRKQKDGDRDEESKVRLDRLLEEVDAVWKKKLRHLMTKPAKPAKLHVRPAKTQISLGICPVWSESSLYTRINVGCLASHWAHSEDWSDWVDSKADLSLRWAYSHFVGFIMRQL